MSDITVISGSGKWYQGVETSLDLRIYVHQTFTSSDGEAIIGSRLKKLNFYKSVNCSVVGTDVIYDEFQLESTTDAVFNKKEAAYTFALFTVAGEFVTTIYKSVKVPPDIPVTSLAALVVFSDSDNAELPPNYLTDEQVYAVIAQALSSITPSVEYSWAVEFTSANGSHVNHGAFLELDTDYTGCTIEFYIKPQGGQYMLSPGYGGSHAPALIGFNGDMTITGNTHDANGPSDQQITTTEKVRHDRWGVVCVQLTGTHLIVYLNGIPSSIVPYTGKMRIANAIEQVLYVGGSDHQNLTGRIAGWRIFMGTTLPWNDNSIYRPQLDALSLSVFNGVDVVAPTLAVPYCKGSVSDEGTGMEKGGVIVKHNGYLAQATTGFSNGYNRDPSKRPVFVLDPFEWPTDAAPQKTQIAGSRIYDDFSRPDVHYGNSVVLGMGTTRVGGKVWSNAAYGLHNGNAYSSNTAPGINIITDAGNVDGTIIWRRPDGAYPGIDGVVYHGVFRYVDDLNYVLLYADQYGQGFVFQYVAGVGTQLGGAGFVFGPSWTEMKVVLTGANCEVFRDAVSVASRTMTEHLTATSKGFLFNSTFQRLSEFAVI